MCGGYQCIKFWRIPNPHYHPPPGIIPFQSIYQKHHHHHHHHHHNHHHSNSNNNNNNHHHHHHHPRRNTSKLKTLPSSCPSQKDCSNFTDSSEASNSTVLPVFGMTGVRNSVGIYPWTEEMPLWLIKIARKMPHRMIMNGCIMLYLYCIVWCMVKYGQMIIAKPLPTSAGITAGGRDSSPQRTARDSAERWEWT